MAGLRGSGGCSRSGLRAECRYFLRKPLSYSKISLSLHPIPTSETGAESAFFENEEKVEIFSPIICAIDFLCLLLQSKTVDSADVAQLARAADL